METRYIPAFVMIMRRKMELLSPLGGKVHFIINYYMRQGKYPCFMGANPLDKLNEKRYIYIIR
jgi:hypothetical protein